MTRSCWWSRPTATRRSRGRAQTCRTSPIARTWPSASTTTSPGATTTASAPAAGRWAPTRGRTGRGTRRAIHDRCAHICARTSTSCARRASRSTSASSGWLTAPSTVTSGCATRSASSMSTPGPGLVGVLDDRGARRVQRHLLVRAMAAVHRSPRLESQGGEESLRDGGPHAGAVGPRGLDRAREQERLADHGVRERALHQRAREAVRISVEVLRRGTSEPAELHRDDQRFHAADRRRSWAVLPSPRHGEHLLAARERLEGAAGVDAGELLTRELRRLRGPAQPGRLLHRPPRPVRGAGRPAGIDAGRLGALHVHHP